MSLTGSLEDLPLLDIIQIVSFSKKTGYLAIRVADQDAAIVFHEGLVVCSYTWDSLPLDARAAALSSAAREGMIRKRIEIALEQLIRLREGEFNFSLTELMPLQVGPRDIRPETLAQGINPQELLLDLARGMDEDRRDSSAVLEASFASPDDPFDDDLLSVATFVEDVASFAAQGDTTLAPLPAPPVAPARAPEAMRDLLELPVPVPIPEAPAPPSAPGPVAGPLRRVLLVDDEADVRATLARHLVAGAYEVHEAESPDDAVRVAARLVKAGTGEFLLVTDLGMPASGGASFQGGFEVVKRLWKMNLKPPVLMMTESLGTTLRARARQMGVTHFVFKPGLSKLDPEQFEADLEAFAARLVNDLLPVMQQPGPQQAKRPSQPRAQGEPVAAAPAAPPPADEASRQMRALRLHLDDLRERGDAAQISLLIMKVAREFFERAVLFLVKNDELRGLGGFGPAPREENLNLLAREVVIPLGEPTIFQRVVNGCKPWSGELPDGKGSGQLMVKIGRYKSARVALLPLLTHRQTTALLFGDNPETGRDLERLEALEVFLDQAGVALENVFLQRKLQSLQAD